MKKILCVCVAAMLLVFGGTSYAKTLDTEDVTELRIAKTDCAYAMQPMCELAETIAKGDIVYVIREEQVEGCAGLTEYVLCNTQNGLRWLWGGFTEYGMPDETGSVSFTITTYCPCSVCNSGFSGTATGTQVTHGRTVAVDPAVIPLGTHVYIDGVGWRVAEDTGGAIRGNIIDLAVAGHDEFDKFSARVWW